MQATGRDGHTLFLGAMSIIMEFLLEVTLLIAQSTYGTINGTLIDPTGAVIQGAKIEVLNLDTKAQQATTTDSAGGFRTVNLDPGIYTITASAEGLAAQCAMTSTSLGRLRGQTFSCK